jgi:hypothetical protein
MRKTMSKAIIYVFGLSFFGTFLKMKNDIFLHNNVFFFKKKKYHKKYRQKIYIIASEFFFLIFSFSFFWG